MNKTMSPAIKKGSGYSREFREEVVRYWLSSGKRTSEVAAELGVSAWSLSRWHKEIESTAVEVVSADFPAVGGELNPLELAKKNGRLRRENEALLRQREILKKAIAIFIAESPTTGLR